MTVDGQVEKVFGPRIFTIDEPSWMDVEGETLVYMPTNLAALVREDDRITVTGEVKPFARGDIDREWGWSDTDADTMATLNGRPVLVASRIVGGDDNVALSISIDGRDTAEADTERAVGTSGTSAAAGHGPRVTNLDALTHADDDLVGRQVTLDGIRLNQGKADGFWLQSGNERLYVLPAGNIANLSDKTAGDLRIDGVVLQMPRSMRSELNPGGNWNDEIYIYAMSVK